MRSVTPSIESAVSRGAGLSGIKYCGGERAGGRSRRRGAGAGRGLRRCSRMMCHGRKRTAAWDEAFSAFGAKAKRTPCSAQALRKRVLKEGSLPAIDPVVDIYNAISIRYAVPVGGENLAAYRGEPRLAIARGDEPFDTLKSAEPVVEYPEPGEVIWRDDIGVTCRRWNWRQGVRTRLDSGAQTMWFILESLPAMPLSALHEAGERLVGYLQQLMPGARASITLLRADDEGDLR